MVPTLETQRLRIRRFAVEDIADIRRFLADPSVSRETPEIPHDEDGLLSYVHTQRGLGLSDAGRCVDLAIERQEDGPVVGLLSFVPNGKGQGEIGWALGAEYRGQGYATEAASGLLAYVFGSLEIHRVSAGTSAENQASWRVMERLGMRKEGHFRQARPPEVSGGAWTDTVCYAVLAEEWFARDQDTVPADVDSAGNGREET